MNNDILVRLRIFSIIIAVICGFAVIVLGMVLVFNGIEPMSNVVGLWRAFKIILIIAAASCAAAIFIP